MDGPCWESTSFEGHAAWRGRNSAMELTLVPSLGSKVVSLKDAATGREWLSRTAAPLGNQGYASAFAEGDGSGWDEMFPTVDACRWTAPPWGGTELPDHGEVWSQPWRCERRGERLHCEVEGRRLPFRLEKTYSFTTGGRLRIDYAAHNGSPAPLPFLWAAHPLFRVHAGMEIVVPAGLDRFAISYSHGGRLGERGTVLDWPRPLPERHPALRLDVTKAADARTAEKFYFDGRLPEGRASLYDPASGERLTLLFPEERVPYLAVWANYGGYLDQYHVALEPATGFLDNAAEAAERGQIAVIPGGGRYEWHLELELGNGGAADGGAGRRASPGPDGGLP